jgi:bifunctional ADP-heptose synthase (sugar kinase/adenylyltransferase)
VYDVTGAGDTVIATLGVALASGTELFEAVGLANLAAGIVVQQVGTAPIRKDDLAEVIHQSSAA